MTNIERTAYRPCVGVMLINRDGLVFVGKRQSERASRTSGHPWQMPQGGIDPGEDPYPAALRELFEETNVRTTSLIADAPDWYSYDIPSELGGKGRFWRGQTQKWFALRFEGAESEIDVLRPGDGRHKAEFSEWRWVPVEDLPGLIVPFKREVYGQIVAVFAPHCVPV